MQLDVYADINQLTNVGEMYIRYDRITNIDLRIPHLISTPARGNKPAGKKKIQIQETSYKTICQNTAFPFSLQQLSKADVPYRELKLTHQILSEELSGACGLNLYVKLTTLQRLRIGYYSRKFFWQSPDFRNKILQAIINFSIPLLLGGLLTWFVMGSGKKNTVNGPTVNMPEDKSKPAVKKDIYKRPATGADTTILH